MQLATCLPSCLHNGPTPPTEMLLLLARWGRAGSAQSRPACHLAVEQHSNLPGGAVQATQGCCRQQLIKHHAPDCACTMDDDVHTVYAKQIGHTAQQLQAWQHRPALSEQRWMEQWPAAAATPSHSRMRAEVRDSRGSICCNRLAESHTGGRLGLHNGNIKCAVSSTIHAAKREHCGIR
jgi:hypothetical protein